MFSSWICFFWALGFLGNHVEAFHWTENYMIPMRDGTKLHTVVFIPFHFPEEEKLASVLIRTPYGADGLKNEGEVYVNQGFNVVMQDFRGRFKSEGSFDYWLNASTDAFDTMEWISKQKWSNGRVFSTGFSANGIAAYMQPMQKPKWLRSQYVAAASAQVFETTFQNGALRHSLIDGWLAEQKEPEWSQIIRHHEEYSPFWESGEETGKWKNIDFPAVHLTGWYDIFNQQQLDAFEAYQTQSSTPGNSFLIVLPSGHCAGGAIPWPNSTLGFDVSVGMAIELFKSQAEKDVPIKDTPLAAFPSIFWYVMGPGTKNSTGNMWVQNNAWPKTTSMYLYLQEKGKLSSVVPDTDDGSSSFVFDPKDPVPTLGGNNLLLPKCGPQDQSKLETRSDVLVFTSDVFTQETVITGNMKAKLYVSSNATDTDFTVKITDVFPTGESMLIQDGILRMRWRDSRSKMSLMQPGQVYEVEVDVWSTSYIFNPGHKVRVDISSSNSPRFTVNPNNGKPLDEEGPMIVAQNTIYHNKKYSSHVILPLVSKEDLKPLDEDLIHKIRQLTIPSSMFQTKYWIL